MTTRQGLRIDTSGLRRRMRQINDKDIPEGSKEHIYLEMQAPFTARVPWCVCFILWITTLLVALYIGSHYMCAFKDSIIKGDCKSPDYIMHPVLMDHVAKGMKTNRRVKYQTSTALIDGKFDSTAIWKKYLYNIEMDTENNKYINNNEDELNIHISAIVYSNQYNTRIGEVGLPLTALYYENSIDQMTIIDDTMNHKSAELWEQEILFDDKLPSEQLRISDLEQHVQDRYLQWDIVDNSKPNAKQFIRTGNIGIWKGYEMGSRLAYIPKTEAMKTQQKELKKNNIELLLFLDTFHQLPFDDEWIRNAIGLFEQYPNLQVLGGFSGIIKNGKTFGDVNVGDMRTGNMDKEAKVFVMSRESNYYKQMVNKRRYDEARVNIVELMDKYKEQYFDKYWHSFTKKAKAIWNVKGVFNDEYIEDDDEEPVGLFSMNFLNDFDKAVFLDEDDPDYDYTKVQTGLEGIQFIVKKRFLEQYEKEIEKRLPIPAKILKQMSDDRNECVNIMKGNPSEEQKHKCELLLSMGGRTLVDYLFIPYEQKIKIYNEMENRKEETWIPFMFITSVRMGPIFIRRDWWFDKLLPHLTELENIMGKIKEDWLDIEISLYTWSLGGYVGLYDAEGFKFDRDDFEMGLNRNKDTDSEWDKFQMDHHLTQIKDWDVWNVTHLVELNEEKNKGKLRLRTPISHTSVNPAHPTAIENSRQIMLTMQTFETQFDEKIYSDKKKKQNFIRLQNRNEQIITKNPLN